MLNYYEKWALDNRALLLTYGINYDDISTNTDKDVIYKVTFYNNEKKEVVAYVSESEDYKKRVFQHLKRWLGNGYLTYWTGLPLDGTWQISFEILDFCNDHIQRIDLERGYIQDLRPFLQWTCEGKFKKYHSPQTPGSCLIPWESTRSLAFKERLKEDIMHKN